MKSFITLSAAVLALAVSSTSFAATNDIALGYVLPSAVSSQLSRADVKAEIKAFHNPMGEIGGAEFAAPSTMSNLNREQVRKEAAEYFHTHHRDVAELG